MKFKLFIGAWIISLLPVFGQQEATTLPQYERELQQLSFRIVNDTTEAGKLQACYAFIPKLVQALKMEGSFAYPFDSLETVSIIYPKDNSFRIFSWQLRHDNGSYRFYGAIQMNTKDGLRLFPLFDYSDSLNNPIHEVLGKDRWFGCLYYGIYDFKSKGKKYYALFGWDGNDLWSAKKIMDILYFEDDEPKFGAPLIYSSDTTGQPQNRLILEYRRDASVKLNYSQDDKMIVFDHLVPPEERLADLKFTYIPDGTYEGLKLKKGKWNYVEKIATIDINDWDNPPVPKPLK